MEKLELMKAVAKKKRRNALPSFTNRRAQQQQQVGF
jgi:hypothetical protein